MENLVAKRMTLKSVAKAVGISNISCVRENENGFKFITILKGNSAFNLYLGEKSGKKVITGDQIPTDLIKNSEVFLAVNNEGEERLKLGLPGTSEYVSVESLFEIDADENAEVINAFKASFTTRQAAPVIEDEVATPARKLVAV
jgi:hypothetical protein